MSSSSKSKSKDKRAGKDQKVPSKAPPTVNGTSSGVPASAYNPVLGTFHTLETSPTSSLTALHVNGRFRNIDETDDNSGSNHGSGADYDSASNNDSRSVESEEHKDKNAPGRQEIIPGADNDKREKIRQKNERKHQRQKEKRAQELHERCSGYLMSRKLESLAQQLVSMGFLAEQATMALILNEGRVEEAVEWLFAGSEVADKDKDQNLDTGGILKIDISEELARIAELEARFGCSKQEVERAIVACEGDLVRAEESLRTQKQDPPVLSLKPEEIGDPNGKIAVPANQNTVMRIQPKSGSGSALVIQQRRDDREFNYTKAPPTAVPPPKIMAKNSNSQAAVRAQVKVPAGASSSTSVSYSLAAPLQVSPPQAKTESRYMPVAAGNEYKTLHQGSSTVREPVVVMQRPQSVNGRQIGSVNSVNTVNAGMVKPNGVVPFIPAARSVSPNDLSHHPNHHLNHHLNHHQDHHQNHQVFRQAAYHHQQQHQYGPGSGQVDLGPNGGQAQWKRVGSSPTLAVASSLGLFSGVGSTCSSRSTSPVDWNTGGSMSSCDYNNIDWSLDRTYLPSMSKPANGFWQGLGSSYHPMGNGQNFYDSIPTVKAQQPMRPPSSNGAGGPMGGFQDGGPAGTDGSGGGSREWTSPFEGKDLFSLPRQFVSSPSL